MLNVYLSLWLTNGCVTDGHHENLSEVFDDHCLNIDRIYYNSSIKYVLLTQAWLVLYCCISHNLIGAFIQFPLEDLLRFLVRLQYDTKNIKFIAKKSSKFFTINGYYLSAGL